MPRERKDAIRAFHCTRLHEIEIADILKEGLKPLDRAHSEARIKRMERAGALTPEMANRIVEGHRRFMDASAAEDRFPREGVIHLCHSPKEGADNFFDNWGGETIYAWFLSSEKDHQDVLSVLRRIGTPCIFEVLLPCGLVEDCGGGTFCVRERIEPKCFRVIRRGDPEFDQLTTWQPLVDPLGPQGPAA